MLVLLQDWLGNFPQAMELGIKVFLKFKSFVCLTHGFQMPLPSCFHQKLLLKLTLHYI